MYSVPRTQIMYVYEVLSTLFRDRPWIAGRVLRTVHTPYSVAEVELVVEWSWSGRAQWRRQAIDAGRESRNGLITNGELPSNEDGAARRGVSRVSEVFLPLYSVLPKNEE